jgi:hypothetical protein
MEKRERKGRIYSTKTKLAGFFSSVYIICISKEFETGEFPFTLQKSPEKIK